jgi:hypothetical protein
MSESRLRAPIGLAWCVASLLAASTLWAQNAAELDKKARAAFDAKDYEGAARTFEEAYKLKPHPATQYNAALAWEKAGELARAADAFESALDSEGLDEGRAGASRDRLAALKRQLGYVFVSKPIGATLSVAHVEKLAIPAKIHLTPGTHEIIVRRPDGSTEKKSVSVRAGESLELAFEGGGLGPGPAPAPDEPPESKPTPVVDEPAAGGSCSQCTWGWVAIGAGAVGAGVGAYFGLRTLSARDEFEDSNRTDAEARDRAVSSRTLSNVGFGVAIVGIGVGVVLLLTAPDSKQEAATRTELRVGPTGVSAALHF